MTDKIYADYNATSPMCPASKKRILQLCEEGVYNPSSIHKDGQKTRKVLEQARQEICTMLNAKDMILVFCSSGTEANNMVFKCFDYDAHIVSAIEHKSILNSSVNPTLIPVDTQGIIDIEALILILENNDQKKIVSVMLANNETGVIQPIKKIAQIVHKYNGILHTDIVQAIGKIHIDLYELEVDMATISGHKIGGGFGAGGLFIKNNISLKQALIEGGAQEKGRRAGTENVISITAMHTALQRILASSNIEKIEFLRNTIENEILAYVKKARTCLDHEIFPGRNVHRLPNTSCIIMPGVNSMVQLIYFNLHNISVSNGAACSVGKIEKSHVLSAMGFSDALASSSLRISLGCNNNENDIEKIISCWQNLFTSSVTD